MPPSAGGRSRPSPNSSARPSTCTPIASRPLGLWNARAAGHDAEEVVDALLKYSRYAVPHALLIDVAETMARYGRLQLTNDPAHGLVLRSVDRAVLEEVLRSPKVAPMVGVRLDDDAVVIHPSERGHLKQVLLKLGWPAEDLAGYVDGEAHAIALVRGRLGDAALPARSRRGLLARRLRRRRAAVWRRQDHRRRGCDGPGAGHHVDPRDEHRRGAAVASRAAQAHDADRRRDRRILRRQEGDPSGHDRDVPGDDDPAQRRLRPSRTVRRARLGPDPLRRGAPAARADLSVHRRHPVAAPARV